MRFLILNAKRMMIVAIVLMLGLGVYLGSRDFVVDVFQSAQREVPIYFVDTKENKIALTFDCAWSDGDIESILQTLDEFNAKATFFVVGDWAERFPESVRKINERGHELGNHSYNHGHYNNMTKEQIIKDMNKCDDLVEDLTGNRPYLFRSPYGEYNNQVILTCQETKREYIQWSIDSLDWKDISKQEIYNRCTQKVKSGDIILLHNGTKYTAEILPSILEKLSMEHTFVSVSDLIYKDNYTIDSQGRQKSIS